MEYLTDGSNAVEVVRATRGTLFIDLHRNVPQGSPAEIGYQERRMQLERQVLAIYEKIQGVNNHINRIKSRRDTTEFFDSLGTPRLSGLTQENSQSELRNYLSSLHESTYKPKIREDECSGWVPLCGYDRDVYNLERAIGFLFGHRSDRAMTQEQYNDAVNGKFKYGDQTVSTDCLKNYPVNIPKASEFGLTEVVGDQLDPNVSNPVEERPSILFGDSTEYKSEMKKLAERFGGE